MHLASGSRTAVTCRVLLWFVAFTSRTLVISSSQQLRSQLYSSSGAASSSGSAMCTVDKPTAVTPAIRSSMLQCAVECTTHSCCLMYQLDAELKQCQLYNYLPLNYSAITGCISSFRRLPNDPGSNETCAFPFTLSGQLYYQCTVNYSSAPCDVLCLTSAQKPIKCMAEIARFVARNVTVNVTIPVSTATVPLMSVNGWLTILSRIDSSFPTGLAYSAYQSGFGDISANFWLGLESVYKLTNTAINGGKIYRLRFELMSASDNRWYSEEYDWFYLESSSTSYTFRASAPGTGDAGDEVNHTNGEMNGKSFVYSSTFCSTTYGPWWYYASNLCCFLRFFGASGSGFRHSTPSSANGDLIISRMMVKQTS